MTTDGRESGLAWLGEVRRDVDLAFEETGALTPGWPDPHPDRSPREEEYSRVLDRGKYRILGARVEAWARVLEPHCSITVADMSPDEPWLGSPRGLNDVASVRRFDPTRAGGLSLLIATTLVEGAPFGIDVAIAGGTGAGTARGTGADGLSPVYMESVPDCGCDACDTGSVDLLDSLDSWFVVVVSGGVVHARSVDRHITRTLHGWSSSGGDVAWLDAKWPVTPDVRRWVGTPWL